MERSIEKCNSDSFKTTRQITCKRNVANDRFDDIMPKLPNLGPKFEVIEIVGKGGMGFVVKVRHKALNAIRAVKVLYSPLAEHSPLAIARFRQEAMIATQLSHPNIVEVYDLDNAPDGTPYIMMEYLNGDDLKMIIERDGPLSVESTVELLSGVADALDKVHARGIIHRDLKPANLFLSDDGKVKILDFGISQVDRGIVPIPEPGTIIGTPLYMAPEQFRKEPVDHRVDIYALTAVAVEMLTGDSFLEGLNQQQIQGKMLDDSPIVAKRCFSGLPVHTAAALLKGLSKNPKERFATAGALITSLAVKESVPDFRRWLSRLHQILLRFKKRAVHISRPRPASNNAAMPGLA